MNQVYTFVLDIFRYHKKKIGFLVASIAFWFVVLFPYDDLSDFVTLKVTQATQSNVYLQFNGLSFGFLPQLGIKMNEVLVESVYAPTLSMKTLGFAPKLSNIFGSPGGIVKAYGLFGGDASIDFGPSNELDVEGEEVGVEVNLEEVALKDLSKFLKKSYNFPLSVQGTTNISSKMNIDPTFKVQPKGRIDIKIKQLNIPSSNLPLPMGAVTMSMPLPSLKLTDVVIEGSLNDGKLFIKEGTIGSGEKKR
jgi:type II secretion system protein N